MARSRLDVTRKFVCVKNTLANGMIEFLFAVGEPDLCVELIMPKAAFDEFCANNKVEVLDTMAPSGPGDAQDFNWNLHQATHQRFR